MSRRHQKKSTVEAASIIQLVGAVGRVKSATTTALLRRGRGERVKTYPKPNGEPFTNDELLKGHHWITTDITCPHCGKEQPVAMTGHVGGPCIRCGKRTIGEEPKP